MNEYKLQAKEHYRKDFDGSTALFNACWKQYRAWLKGSINNPKCDYDVIDWLDKIAAEKVNNPRSVFYMYG